MPINDLHPEHVEMAERWRRCRDVASGSDAVKGAGTLYLPRPEGMSSSFFSNAYNNYLGRALFYGAFARTVDALAGAIGQKAPAVEAPAPITEQLADVTLTNTTLELFALKMIREILTTGRYGVLVDMAAEPASSQRPFWAGYRAEDVVSWRTTRRGGDEVLTRVVLCESVTVEKPDDPYRLDSATQYRELMLTEAGYQIRLWVKLPADHLRSPGADKWIASESVTALRRGKPLDFIPFVFVNASSLSPSVSRPPLVDLADIALSHYRTSADLEHLLHYVGLPTPWASGLLGAESNAPLRVGSDVAWLLTTDGRAGMLEMSGAGASAIREHMKDKESLMATLGARLLEAQSDVPETATAVGMRHSGEHATLRTIAQVAEQGLTKALQWHSWWMGLEDQPVDTKARVELTKDFFITKLGPDALRAWLMAYQAGAVSYETFYEALRRGDAIRPGVTAEQELREIEITRTGATVDDVDDEEKDAA